MLMESSDRTYVYQIFESKKFEEKMFAKQTKFYLKRKRKHFPQQNIELPFQISDFQKKKNVFIH